MTSPGCVVLFTKPARAGRVKTRLIGELTAPQAAALHAAFVGDLTERLLAGGFDLQVAWALEEDEDPPADLLPTAVPGLRQEGADLGERLYRALAAVGRDYPRVAAVGSDHPDLALEVVEEAFDRLSAAPTDVVLGPARDGGYYLIAVRTSSLRRRLFEDIAWSTERVLEQTLERCRESRLRYELLTPGSDVDTPQDLRRLAESTTDLARCPRTHQLLKSLGRV